MDTINFRGYYAGFVSRLLAYAIDLAIITICLVFFGWLIQTVNSIFQLNLINSLPDLAKVLVTSITALFFAAGYFTFFWTLVGQTPGKLLLGLRVVDQDGKNPTFGRSLIRVIGYALSALALYAGYWWILFDNRRQGWHDKLAGTYVIYAWDARTGALVEAKIRESRRAQAALEQETLPPQPPATTP